MSRRSIGWSSCRARRMDRFNCPTDCEARRNNARVYSELKTNMKNGLRVLFLLIVGAALAAGAGFAADAGATTPEYKLAATVDRMPRLSTTACYTSRASRIRW